MTVLLLVAWLLLTRVGRTERVWPEPSPVRRKPPSEALTLDNAAVSAEAFVAVLALVLIPWTMFFDAFLVWEVIGLWLIWPFVLRYAIDRVIKLRAGHLAEVTERALVVPGLPRRVVSWDRVEAIDVRRVRFGPDDILIRGGAVPVVLDTQFSRVAHDEMVRWLIAAVDDHRSGP